MGKRWFVASAAVMLVWGLIFAAGGCSAISTIYTAEKPVVIYVPLDDRPINYDDVLSLGEAAGVEVLTPPGEMLEKGSSAVDTELLLQWLENNIHRADACVLSIDMLLHGGLVPSRTHDNNLPGVIAGVNKLQAVLENSDIPVYGFATVMRSAASSASGMQPAYFEEYGDKLLFLSQLTHLAELGKATQEQLSTMHKIKENLPLEVLEDYLGRRDTNHAALQTVLRLVGAGHMDYLVLGRDDNTEYSFSSMEFNKLTKSIEELEIEDKASGLTGTDELGAIMLARAINKVRGSEPRVYVHWSTPQGLQLNALYEDNTLGECVNDHLQAAGAEKVDTPQEADLVLAVNSPEEKMQEAVRQGDTGPTGVHRETAQWIHTTLKNGPPVAVADVAYANGSDRAFMQALTENELFPRLAGYAGCNTAGNSAGMALAQGLIYTGTPSVTGSRGEPHQNVLLERLIEDWSYQAVVRPSILENNPGIKSAGQQLEGETLSGAEEEIAVSLNKFVDKELEGQFGTKIRVTGVTLPWDRLFDLRFEVETGQGD